ncbi:hypothetical protein F4803DRAFT_266200 [Xylaria telfairii]|nr:hypothetical protein F4803DRAFT_266200 [Xylaria telfairii]
MSHTNPNPRYKGKNYDPNYNANKRNQTNQTNQLVNNPTTSHIYNPFQQQGPDQNNQAQQQQQQQYQSSATAIQVLQEFCKEAHDRLSKDRDGDTRMCQCPTPNGPSCFHAIASLYRDQLVSTAELQHDLVELLNYLMEKEASPEGSILTRLREFANGKPNTPLQLVLTTMLFKEGPLSNAGVEGLIIRGVGTAIGTGVEVLIDTAANLPAYRKAYVEEVID